MPTLMHPDLVQKHRAHVLSLEIGIDKLPDELKNGWMKKIHDFTCTYIEEAQFAGQATMWNWLGSSVNFSATPPFPTASMFHVVFGLPDRFLQGLERHLQRYLGQECVGIKEYITFDMDDGWMAVCHVEHGTVWEGGGDEWTPAAHRPVQASEMHVEPSEKAPEVKDVPSSLVTVPPSTSSSVSDKDEDLACTVRDLFGDGVARQRDNAIRELARMLGYQRAGINIRSRMDNALRAAMRRGIIANFPEGIRLTHKSIEGFEKGILQAQFLASLRGRNWTERDESIQAFARWLGFSRTGKTIRKTAEAVIRSLSRQGRIERREGWVRRSAKASGVET